jgi:glycosyltransferase involved in cell wall biosynthesis
MKVLMIEHFSPANNYSFELCEELGKEVNLTILTVKNSDMKTKDKYAVKKVLYGYGHGKSVINLIKYFRSLIVTLFEIIKGNYDVIHIQTFRNFKIESVLYKLLRPFVKKMVLTAHNILPHEDGSKAKEYFKLTYSYVDQIIVHNVASKNALINSFHVPEKKISISPHGIYSQYIEKGINEIDIKSSIKKRILFFGLIRKYKGVEVLLEAIKLLPEKYKGEVEFIIAGTNSSNLNIKQFVADNNLESIINLNLEFIPDNDVSKYFLNTDAVILPYLNIYGSGALLLSYTFLKPVIVSNLPTFIEETNNGSTGYIFKSNDSSDLMKTILTFLNSSELEMEEKRENIRKLVKHKYNWSFSAKETKKVYSL